MRGMKVGALSALLFLSVASPGLSGMAMACSDTASAAMCMAGDLVWGPSGLVPFATHEVEWARAVVWDVIFVILPGGWL